MEKIIKYAVLLLMSVLPFVASAQTDRDHIRSGNKLYRQKKYPAAEVEYRKAVSLNANNPQALYNLGCVMMMQNKGSEAIKLYEKASKIETNKMRRAKIFHNIGIICQSSKMYGEAIKAYSESLRNNPSDNETRYNLALCKKLQKNDKNKDKNKNQNKNNDKQKGKDKQKEQKSDTGKNNDKKDQQRNSQKDQPQMSKDNAEQLLNAAMQQEQQTQERLNKSRQQQQSRHFEKNW